jgi:hypothetical protein
MYGRVSSSAVVTSCGYDRESLTSHHAPVVRTGSETDNGVCCSACSRRWCCGAKRRTVQCVHRQPRVPQRVSSFTAHPRGKWSPRLSLPTSAALFTTIRLDEGVEPAGYVGVPAAGGCTRVSGTTPSISASLVLNPNPDVLCGIMPINYVLS